MLGEIVKGYFRIVVLDFKIAWRSVRIGMLGIRLWFVTRRMEMLGRRIEETKKDKGGQDGSNV